jgi:hypothetical protein
MRSVLVVGGLLPLAAAFAAVPMAAAAPTSQHGTPIHRGLERKTDYVILEEIAHDPSSFT